MTYIVIVLPVLLSGLTFIVLLKIFEREMLSFPLDLGVKFKNKRIFGKNKTIKGPIVMSLFTGLYGWLLIKILPEFTLTLSNLTVFYYYFLIGLSYSLGELPNSFIKRQLSIPPGGASKKKVEACFFRILDIVDSLIFCGIAYYCLFKFPIGIIFRAILLGSIFHLATDQLMIGLKLKNKN